MVWFDSANKAQLPQESCPASACHSDVDAVRLPGRRAGHGPGRFNLEHTQETPFNPGGLPHCKAMAEVHEQSTTKSSLCDTRGRLHVI